MRKVILICLVLLAVGYKAMAQQDPMYTQYMFNQLPVNPAYAGSKDRLTGILLYRTQWVGFEGSPKTTSLSVHSPVVGTRSSFGGTLVHDAIGISNNLYFTGNYAYRIDFEKFRVAMGLSAEFKRQQMNWDMVNPLIPLDPNLPALPANKMLPNFGAGLYIDADKFYVGVSTPRLLENKLDYTNGLGTLTTSAKQKRHLYFMGGLIMKINDDVKFKPAALIKYTDNAPMEVDFNTSFLFSERLWLGATFRTGDSFDLTAQIIFKNVRIGYAYDFTLTRLNAYSNGTHEILISVEMDNKVKGIYHPRYF